MRLYSHFAVVGFSNTYLFGPDSAGDAVLIDPGIFDIQLLQLIEAQKFYVRFVLVTHAHTAHINGIRTLLKIYDAQVYSFNDTVLEIPATPIREGEPLQLGEISFQVLETPGHSADSVVFRADKFLFTGDTLAAGSIGTTSDGYARGLEIASIRKKILSLDDDLVILPGHGPPSRVRIEKHYNPYIKHKL